MTAPAPRGRRDFLRSLAGGLIHGVGEVAKAREAVVLPLIGARPAEDAAHDGSPQTARPNSSSAAGGGHPAAAPAIRLAGPDEVAALADEAGLGARLDAIRSLGRTSIRLTPARPGDGGGAAWVAETRMLVLDFARLPATGAALPDAGILSCGVDGDALRIEYDADGPFSEDEPLEPSAEYVLPRFWADPVQATGLEPDELDAWERLRTLLAEAQGVEPPAATPPGLIRVGGYPDEKVGDMPLTCELRARGYDTSATGAVLHPAAKQHADGAARWRMLLQLPVGEGRRCFVWTTSEQLAANRFAEAQAFVR
jgi:hypothetical protein